MKKSSKKRKKPAEAIADEIKKAGKGVDGAARIVKKNWRKIILIASIASILIIFALFVTGLRIRFAVQDDLIISIDPANVAFTINNDQSQDVTFSISTRNSIFCEAECAFTLYDRSGEKIIDQGDVRLKDKQSIEKTYTLIPFRKGSGQKIYNFEVQCSNMKTFFCSTQSPLRKRLSFITLNYKLTEKELQLKEEVEQKLTKSFTLINNASQNIQKSEKILEIKPIGSFKLKSLGNALELADIATGLWLEEDYLQLESYADALLNLSNSLYKSTKTTLSSILSSINKQNTLSKKYNKLKSDFFQTASNITIKDSCNKVYTYLQNIKLGKYQKISSLEKDIAEVEIIIDDINLLMDNITTAGKSLVEQEYSKKCFLGYCENTTNICADLHDIIEEYNNKTYTSAANISGITYYQEFNNTIKILISNESKEFHDEYCKGYNVTTIQDMELLSIPKNISTKNIIENELAENKPKCCIYGKCSPCCDNDECKNDEELFPVILIHGHSLLRKTSPEPTSDIFNKIQYQLQEDGYINTGSVNFDFNISDYKESEWGLSGFPIVTKASYYYDYFYSFGRYIYVTKSTDNLDTYAIRLNDIIKVIKYRTGKPKVNIIAHSMGGLVARRYVQIFGDNSVNKLILIATPNKGIEGDIKKLCHIFGEKKECEDMYADSILIKKLAVYSPESTRFYTISGKGCKTADKDGDGIATFESSLIDYAESFTVDGTCTDFVKASLHMDLLDIDKYPEVYGYITEVLESS